MLNITEIIEEVSETVETYERTEITHEVETRETRETSMLSMEFPPQDMPEMEIQIDVGKPPPPPPGAPPEKPDERPPPGDSEEVTIRRRIRETTSTTMRAPKERHTRARATATLDVEDTREPEPIEIEMKVDKPPREPRERPAPKERPPERPKEHLVPPMFVKRIRTVTVKEGQPAVFEGEVTGVPMPEVTWLKDGEVIEDAPEYKVTYKEGVCTLELNEAFPEDTGKVVCKAENRAGVVTCTAKLIVLRGR